MTPDVPSSRPIAYADTNLFVALLAGPAHGLHPAALDLFRRVADGTLSLVLTPVVMAELVYAARTVLGWDRPTTSGRLASLMTADGIRVPEGAVLAVALQIFSDHPSLDFPDAYLAALAVVEGPAVVASFDRGLDAVKGVDRIAV